jgi:hypothetical protein
MTASELKVGTPELQFVPVNQSLLVVPVQLSCDQAGAEEMQTSATIANATRIQPGRGELALERNAFMEKPPQRFCRLRALFRPQINV